MKKPATAIKTKKVTDGVRSVTDAALARARGGHDNTTFDPWAVIDLVGPAKT